ncbi:Methylamine utilization protein MauE [Mariniflexile rhizosphaerae]|uniref:MauE/DoxX family redox-associated membrane protein n=1 Tax=unclassified Mariniflexile TaxID=2643887 RepID=UPI000CB7815D|nr:MauE/DoxX family redox-associated membrane protein [Mariniflexile sp. TRM1-10]AXP80868.1 Methylamine utilization protein MauE [Mariniflexile sp. TRM1-10]PLB17962.1 MAG: hypothetical protein TRG1_3218 [Flavobacteriaceae bacterium FS1-H7996/R]
MKIHSKYRNILLEIICFLFILLFVYAAMSKLLVFDQFKIQVGQSAMLTPIVDIIAWGIPFLEFVIALMLIIPRFKRLGLYAAFTLMVMFTTYIFIILNFSNDIPCSCGGVLEKLGWTEHLIFNIAFVFLAFTGILLMSNDKMNNDNKNTSKNYLYDIYA